MKADAVLDRLALPAVPSGPVSSDRFPDGAAFRVEIPSVEGARVLSEVVRSAEQQGIVVNRVSQGSGAMLLRESELREMAAIGAEAGIEVSLFTGPRAGFDVGVHTRSADGAAHFGQVRGMRGLAYAAEDIARACEAGIRSFLIADAGLLDVLCDMQRAGELPAECVWKISVMLAPSNPAGLRVLERLGASTINIASDTTVAELAEMRAVSKLPIDLYVESPDALGGVVRGNEIGDLIAAGAPLYTKFGLRNSRALYPSGEHLVDEACSIAREKVRRAAVALEWLRRLAPRFEQSAPHAQGLGVPKPTPQPS